MKKVISVIILALTCIMGYAQTIDPALEKEMGQKKDDEKIRVFVIMKQQYDREQLCRRADYYTTRAARREFVVNELKQFAEASQYDIRTSLAEMKRSDMVTEPEILWMANALYFSATKQAIYDLAKRKDVEILGFDEEKEILFDEESRPTSNTRDIAPNVTQVNADQVWDLGYTGQGIVVAVIDTGVNYEHLDLADHLWDGGSDFPHHGWDIGDDDNDPMDESGHGTHCAGTVCGDGGGGRMTGMAPDVSLMCVKARGSSGYTVAKTCNCMQWAVEHGADVFSMSLGWSNPSISERVLFRNTCGAVLDAGVIGSIAAGNEGNKLHVYPIPNNVRFPGGCPPPYMDPIQQGNPGGLSCVVCVGNVNYNDVASPSSSRGPVTWTNTSYGDYPYVSGSSTQFGLIRPDVCAPGTSIISADYSNNNGYCVKSGTSMATPCVAGCMALMLSKNPELTPAEICRILEETAVPRAEGKSNIYGYGRVDALAAINAVPDNILSLASYTIHDEQGNNDQQLNAGESVTMDMDLHCGPNALNNATLNITCGSEFVTITNGTIALPDFAAGQTQTVTGFAFSVDESAPARRKMTFCADVIVEGVSVGHFAFTLAVKGNIMVYESATIVNDDNGNGLLEPGETADLHIAINNVGNMVAPSVTGTLSSTNEYLTINSQSISVGDVGVYEQTYIDFSVTLAPNATNAFPIPCTLNLVDIEAQTSELGFSLFNIIATANPQGIGTLSGAGTYGTGTTVTLSTITDNTCTFINWKRGNTVVSYTDFSISVSENANYVANFNSISNVVPVGQAVSKSYYLPTSSYFNYILAHQIYTTEELGQAFEISSVAFFNASTTRTRNCRIYMKHTEKAVFQDVYDWEAVTPEDMLFEGDITFTKGEWTTIYFDRAFAYDGIHNVLMVFDDNTGSYVSDMQLCRVFYSESNQSHYAINDETNYDPYNPFEIYGYVDNEKSQALFGIASYDYTVTVSADPVDGGIVSVDEGPFFYGQPCTATATPSGDNVFYYWSENGEWVSSDATYTFRVMANRQLVAHFGPPVNVTVVADSVEGGMVSGGGLYGIGQPLTLSATVNPGYVFSHWSLDGEVVSYLSSCDVLVPGEAEYVAHFDPLAPGAVAVGQAALTNTLLPSYTYYNYTLSQQIYTAAEIGEAGFIGSIAFFNTGYQRKRDLAIYMVNTTKTTFSSNSDWIVPTEEQQVFSGEVIMVKGHWTTIVLDKPFEYDGVSNLALIVDDNSGYWTDNFVSCRTYEVSGNQAIRVYSDGTNYNPLNPSGYSGTRMTVKNQIVVTKVTPTGEFLNVTLCADPAMGGTVSGGGVFGFGESCVATAAPNEGYTFTGWSENGTIVSTDSSYTFSVYNDRDLVASFSKQVQIGDGGTATNSYLPSFNYYKYSLTQQIYTAEEIGRAGTIASVAFYNGGAEKTRTYDFYLVHSDKATFSGNKDWVAVTNADKVFSGVVTMTADEWTTIVFDVPFEYDGISNLILVVDDNSGAWTSTPHMSCRVSDAPSQAIYVYSDGTNYNPKTPSGYNGTVLNVKNQISLGITPSRVTQTCTLSQGTNWFSANVEITMDDLKAALEAVASGTITITSQRNGVTIYNGTRWRGALNTLDVSQGYKITVAAECEIALEGILVDPAEHPVTINSDANWIGFPLREEMTIAEAFARFAVNGDVISSQREGVATYNGTRWRGALGNGTLKPGQGYIYKSSATGSRVLVFPTSLK